MKIENINSLSARRPIYHSESDLQFALAWELKESLPNIEIRLEKPFKKQYIDIIYTNANETIGIELKYKTDEIQHTY